MFVFTAAKKVASPPTRLHGLTTKKTMIHNVQNNYSAINCRNYAGLDK